MIDTDNPLLQTLADDFVELHNVGGIELEQWETAYKFVKHFYHTEEMVQIIIRGKKVMTYLVATTEVIYDEQDLIKMMLATGEYGIHGHPISHEAMIEFVKDNEWQIEHHLFLDKFDVPAQISIKDEDGTDLFFAKNKLEIK